VGVFPHSLTQVFFKAVLETCRADFKLANCFTTSFCPENGSGNDTEDDKIF
jgi:hypothetical protein